MKMRKLICAFLALVMTSLVLCSCGETADVIYAKDKSGNIVAAMNENMFSYHLSEQKSSFVMLGVEDTAEYWNKTPQSGGRSMGDIVFDYIVDSAKKIVAGAYLYETVKNSSEDAKAQFSQNELDIEKQLDAIEQQLISSMGSKSALESYLSGFGIDLKNLRKYNELLLKNDSLKNSIVPEEEDKKEYFAENYAIVKHILVNTTFKAKEDGSLVSLTEDEIAAKLELADSINARLSAGEAFEELWEQYKDADAAGAAKYPEGYFVCENSGFTKAFEQAALDMQVGEIRTVKGDYGVHIIKKYPMDAEKYNLYEDVDTSLENKLSDRIYSETVAPYAAAVVADSELLSGFSIVSAPTMLG